MIRNYTLGFTHGGTMHSDEVFASAFLRMIDKDFKIIRQFNRECEIPKEENILVFDIGLGKYDHHQKDAKLRSNGNKYASVGLILKEFWKDIGLTELEYLYLDKVIVEKIDYADNYGNLCDYATMIDYFNLSWIDLKDKNEEEIFEMENIAFEKAIKFASDIIFMELLSYRTNHKFNTINQIEKLFCQVFMDIVDEKYKNESNFLDIIKKYGINILDKDCINYLVERMTRFQNLFDGNKLDAGFIKFIGNFDISNDVQRKKVLKIINFILKKEILKAHTEYLAKDYINKIYKNSKSNYLVFDLKKIPWIREVTSLNDSNEHKIDFVIYLNDNKGCGVQCVPNSFYLKNSKRVPFPKQIRGASKDILENYLEGLTFCHSTGFFCTTKNLDSAIKLVEKVSKNNGRYK